jgi:hypothetical protein
MTGSNRLTENLAGLTPLLTRRIRATQAAIEWVREASAEDLLDLACTSLGIASIASPFGDLSAVDLGDMPRHALIERLSESFPSGTGVAADLADQIQLCRAFEDPAGATAMVEDVVREAIKRFPATADAIKVGHNPGDVLDPFILAANFELLSERSLRQTVEATTSHKILMKIEDLAGNLHQSTIASMRGNFRVPEPGGSREEGKERLDRVLNPFPGADMGQVPVPPRPEALRLFQVKSKTGSAKGGDGKRLGEQLAVLEETYGADTFYAAIVGNTLRGHRSKGAVLRASPRTAVLVGEAALNELTQSAVGGELLLRIYQRAFRSAAAAEGYEFTEVVRGIVGVFEREAEAAGEDFLTTWLHVAIGGPRSGQDSRSIETGGQQEMPGL